MSPQCERLVEFLDGELVGEERAAMAAHVARCSDCCADAEEAANRSASGTA